MIRFVFLALALVTVAAFVVGCEKSIKMPSISVTATESGRSAGMTLPSVPEGTGK